MLVDLQFKIIQRRESRNQANTDFWTEVQDGNTFVSHLEVREKAKPEKHSLAIASRIGQGVYYSFCLDNFLDDYSDHRTRKDQPFWPFSLLCESRDLREMASGKHPPVYGNTDNLQQIHRRCRKYWTSDRHFVLLIHEVSKEHNAGWRWHKNGGYYGKHKPKCEHIGDEPKITKILHFNFIEVIKREREAGEVFASLI